MENPKIEETTTPQETHGITTNTIINNDNAQINNTTLLRLMAGCNLGFQKFQ